ncbi:MFS transporter [Cohnella faecalis]|uniref:MFS transporter n=1 Tax=Cohnella faecalis TaxID=2315694 RepID=UPI00268FB10E|nr:MFS transporter [Cohnella faecalis]
MYGEEIHVDHVGLFFLFNVASVLIVRPLSGRLFDRKGPAAVLLPAALFSVAGLLILSYAHSLGMLILSALLYGAGFGAIQPTTQAWMIRAAGPEKHSASNSLYYNTTDIGVAFGSMLLAEVASAVDYAFMYRFASGIMVLFVVLQFVDLAKGRSKRNAAAA